MKWLSRFRIKGNQFGVLRYLTTEGHFALKNLQLRRAQGAISHCVTPFPGILISLSTPLRTVRCRTWWSHSISEQYVKNHRSTNPLKGVIIRKRNKSLKDKPRGVKEINKVGQNIFCLFRAFRRKCKKFISTLKLKSCFRENFISGRETRDDLLRFLRISARIKLRLELI